MLRMKSVAGLYVGWESSTDERKVVSRAWFRELNTPWRVGSGIRFRVGHRAVQVGRCRPNPEVDSAIEQLGGRELADFTPAEIGAWRGPGDRSEPPPAA